jgi:hypothetical protein
MCISIDTHSLTLSLSHTHTYIWALTKLYVSFTGSGFGLTSAPSSADPWQIAQPANMAQIQDLQVQCEKDMMRVRIIFDRPFYGMVFSKGHYSNVNCVHVPSGLGQTQATFDIALQVRDSCREPLLKGSSIST